LENEIIKKGSRQVPKTFNICSDKKYNDILYSYLQCMSEKRDDDSRYILKKNIKYTKLGEALGLSRQTISTRFKNLIQLGLIEEKNDTYELVRLDNNVAWLIQ
jgi:predicted transcriptional regulator